MQMNYRQDSPPACLWKQAGVVDKKECHADFYCGTCRFDRALKRVCRENESRRDQGRPLQNQLARFEFWQDRMNRRPASKRPCIHHMKGHIPFKSCLKSYHCVDCEFDQYFNDQFKVHAVLNPVLMDNIHGISLPAGFYLHRNHTWIKIEDQGMVRIGIDDFAGTILGPFDAVSTPQFGKQVHPAQAIFTLRRDDHAVSFLSPVNGVVTQVNPEIEKNPELISKDPYTRGWIMMLHCKNLKQDLKHLMFMDTGKSFMTREVDRLFDFLENNTGLKAADGGMLCPDLFGNLHDISWNTWVQEFIHDNG